MIAKMKDSLMNLICGVCKHQWIPRKNPIDIKFCPRCHSFNWRKKKEIEHEL